jgi:hypothetical protein
MHLQLNCDLIELDSYLIQFNLILNSKLNSNALIGISQFNLIQFKNWIKIQLKKKK